MSGILTDSERNARIGEVRRMNCGMNATIIDCLKGGKVIIQFEDGVTSTVQYHRFRKGCVGNHNIPKTTYKIGSTEKGTSRIGEIHTMKNGEKLEIIEYTNSSIVKVRFENGVTKISDYHIIVSGYLSSDETGEI